MQQGDDELPLIGSLCLRTDFWDRLGANILARIRLLATYTFSIIDWERNSL